LRLNELKTILKKGESANTEFKESFSDSLIETLVAFSNTKGGKVFLGVTDKGLINGTSIGKETIANWINEIKNKTQPFIIPDFEIVEVSNKKIILINISEYANKPVSFKGRYYKRINNSNHIMSIDEVVNLHLQAMNSSWDYFEDKKHSLNDISLEKVASFLIKLNQNRHNKIIDSPLFVLNKFELLKNDTITRACFLLFTKEENVLTTIELARFQEETLIKDAKTIKLDLFSELEEVLSFILKHINKEYIITGKIKREEKWAYPLEAIREIIINMIVHRDYSKAQDSIIKIFDNRIEFYNPGVLPEGLTVKQLMSGEYVSSPRNKQIAEVFKEAGIIEKYGSGIKRIIDAFKKHNLEAPKFEETSGGFKVTIYNSSDSLKKERWSERWSETLKLVLETILFNPDISRKELSKKLKINPSVVQKNIDKLKKLKIISRVGGAKGGYWKINKK